MVIVNNLYKYLLKKKKYEQVISYFCLLHLSAISVILSITYLCMYKYRGQFLDFSWKIVPIYDEYILMNLFDRCRGIHHS